MLNEQPSTVTSRILTENKKYLTERVRDIVDSYLETALWSSTDFDTDQPLDDTYDISDFTRKARREAEQDVEGFLDLAGDLVDVDGKRDEQIGHDFWLTRNGHGAGFWDGDYPIAGNELTKISKTFGSVDIFPTGDGKVEFS